MEKVLEKVYFYLKFLTFYYYLSNLLIMKAMNWDL